MTFSGIHAETGKGTTNSYHYIITEEFSHDTGAFTQGLVMYDGFLYEGTGIRGKSAIRKIRLETGEVLQNRALPDQYFGEGITILHDKLIQLTWRAGTGLVYDRDSLTLIRLFQYTGEGWGLTHDGKHLIMSNGSEKLSFLNPDTFHKEREIIVTDNGRLITRLNELEYVGGMIYANVWRTDTIALIDPQTGNVTGWIHLEGLSRRAGGDRAVKTLNGIAYNSEKKRLLVTGKLWPKIYAIELVPVHSKKGY